MQQIVQSAKLALPQKLSPPQNSRKQVEEMILCLCVAVVREGGGGWERVGGEVGEDGRGWREVGEGGRGWGGGGGVCSFKHFHECVLESER